MKRKYKFIEKFFCRQGYGAIMAGDHEPDPWITYFPHDKYKSRYTFFFKRKKYYDQTTKIAYTPTQFVRYIKRLENLISFW